jgi:hypothetical protein
MYVQRGSKFCFVLLVLVGVTDIAQNTALLSNFTMLSAYCTVTCSLARQPCQQALPGSLARQPCAAALPGNLARQYCQAAFFGSLARQPCSAALLGSLARQPCSAALFGSLAEILQVYYRRGRQNCKLFYGRRPACIITCFYRPKAGNLVQAFPAINKTF